MQAASVALFNEKLATGADDDGGSNITVDHLLHNGAVAINIFLRYSGGRQC